MSLRNATPHRRVRPFLAAALAVFALSACGDGGFAGLNPFKADTIDVACPPFGSLKEADSLTRFRPGEGRDLTDVQFEAEIGRVVGKCQVTQSTQLAAVTAGVEIIAERGPALAEPEPPIEYFIAIRDPEDRVVSRQNFALAFDFSDGARTARALDYLTFKIPNATPEALRGYRIFFGLQMTEAEWAFSQRTRQRR